MATHIRDYDLPGEPPGSDASAQGAADDSPPLIPLDLSDLEDPASAGSATDPSTEGPGDYPILTEVVDSVTETQPAPRHLGLDELEHELRTDLINEVSGDLEQRIESRIYGRLSTSIDEIATRLRNELFTEVRRAIREAVAEVLEEEKQRVQDAHRTTGQS